MDRMIPMRSVRGSTKYNAAALISMRGSPRRSRLRKCLSALARASNNKG